MLAHSHGGWRESRSCFRLQMSTRYELIADVLPFLAPSFPFPRLLPFPRPRCRAATPASGASSLLSGNWATTGSWAVVLLASVAGGAFLV